MKPSSTKAYKRKWT